MRGKVKSDISRSDPFNVCRRGLERGLVNDSDETKKQ